MLVQAPTKVPSFAHALPHTLVMFCKGAVLHSLNAVTFVVVIDVLLKLVFL